jgi:2-polyprenyl-3-methyl-5-hydroxy-6-metoxy-1,4-benzoquinol methylase
VDAESHQERPDYAGYHDWKGWHRPFHHDARDAEILDGEFTGVPLDGARLLEIGFGEGRLMSWARARGAEVVGTEVQPALIAAAKAAGYPVADADLVSLAASSPATHDVVVALDVLEHFAPGDLPGTLDAISRLLVPGGRLVARFPNGQSPLGRVYQYGDPTHLAVLSIPILRHHAGRAGLVVERAGNAYRPLGVGAARRIPTRLRHGLRSMVEWSLATLYTLERVPFDPNVTMVLRRPPDDPT